MLYHVVSLSSTAHCLHNRCPFRINQQPRFGAQYMADATWQGPQGRPAWVTSCTDNWSEASASLDTSGHTGYQWLPQVTRFVDLTLPKSVTMDDLGHHWDAGCEQ